MPQLHFLHFNTSDFIETLHLRLCILKVLLSKATYIAFKVYLISLPCFFVFVHRWSHAYCSEKTMIPYFCFVSRLCSSQFCHYFTVNMSRVEVPKSRGWQRISWGLAPTTNHFFSFSLLFSSVFYLAFLFNLLFSVCLSTFLPCLASCGDFSSPVALLTHTQSFSVCLCVGWSCLRCGAFIYESDRASSV